MPFSRIQNSIILKLKNADRVRFTDLRPKNTPNDLFNYHLKSLIEKGYIDKDTEGYRLSPKGQAYVADSFHTSDPNLNRLFKVNVITIVSKEEDNQIFILNQRRTSHPSFGLVDVMGGTIMKGEPILDGAHRKLLEETGLDATFRILGIERRIQNKNGKLFSDIIFPICYADQSVGEPTTTEFGDNFWVSIDDAIEHAQRADDNIPSIADCLRAIKTGDISNLPPFFRETIQ